MCATSEKLVPVLHKTYKPSQAFPYYAAIDLLAAALGVVTLLCMGPGAASWRPVSSSLAFPHLVVLHHALQHWACVLKNVCHALEERNAHNAEEAQLQAATSK